MQHRIQFSPNGTLIKATPIKRRLRTNATKGQIFNFQLNEAKQVKKIIDNASKVAIGMEFKDTHQLTRVSKLHDVKEICCGWAREFEMFPQQVQERLGQVPKRAIRHYSKQLIHLTRDNELNTISELRLERPKHNNRCCLRDGGIGCDSVCNPLSQVKNETIDFAGGHAVAHLVQQRTSPWILV